MNIFNPKKPRDILAALLRDRGIPGTIRYDRKRHSWMYVGNNEQKLGTFFQAIMMITGGTLDFIAEHHRESLCRTSTPPASVTPSE